MSESAASSHAPLKLAIKFALNVLLVYLLATYLSAYFLLDGGIRAYVIVGSLITLMNIFFRPVIYVLTLPLRLFTTIVAVIIIHGGFVYVVTLLTAKMDPNLVRLEIFGGPWGWIVIAVCLGLANWIMKEMFK
ncbi:phage holin family protein [Candidatus Peregrinibacteria bacterium]|nr:phage holin family protein [Candidatus Peregrinibacteria bacterium]